MHIPQGPTATLALELFDDALAAALRPSPDYDVSRWLYVPNHYSEYRYILGTRGRKPLICMGINPSTANEQLADGHLCHSTVNDKEQAGRDDHAQIG